MLNFPWYPYQKYWTRTAGRPFASLADQPGEDNSKLDTSWRDQAFKFAFSSQYPRVQQLETCAICVKADHSALEGRILACVKWGHRLIETAPVNGNFLNMNFVSIGDRWIEGDHGRDVTWKGACAPTQGFVEKVVPTGVLNPLPDLLHDRGEEHALPLLP